jgi:hypothetical protein
VFCCWVSCDIAAPLAAALSRACRWHAYELAATADELTRWPSETVDLVALIRSGAQVQNAVRAATHDGADRPGSR